MFLRLLLEVLLDLFPILLLLEDCLTKVLENGLVCYFLELVLESFDGNEEFLLDVSQQALHILVLFLDQLIDLVVGLCVISWKIE